MTIREPVNEDDPEERVVGSIELRSEEESKEMDSEDYDVEKADEESLTENISNNNEPTPETRWPFPKAFYDPTTKKIMLDPVVHPDGDSHEKNSQDVESNVKHYPNRALKSYIESELDRFGASSLEQWGESLRSGWQTLLERSPLPAGEQRALPESFYCPISFELIHQPVIDPDGYTYEKAAIEHWLGRNGDSPVTRKELTIDQLYKNNAMLSVLEALSEEDAEVMHPSILKWKEEHPNHQFTVPTVTESERGEQPYPTSQAELDERRRQRRQNNCTTFSLLLACLVVFLFFPSYFFLFTIIATCAYFIYEPYLRRQQEARRIAIRNTAIQEMEQQRQQQIQQREQELNALQQNQQPEQNLAQQQEQQEQIPVVHQN